MCRICSEWEMGKLTAKEAWQNLRETVDIGFKTEEDFQHYMDTVEKLVEADATLKD